MESMVCLKKINLLFIIVIIILNVYLMYIIFYENSNKKQKINIFYKMKYDIVNARNNLNDHTRGEPEQYKLLGLVIRDNTETIYKLYGRLKIPRSNRYEYYVTSTENNQNVKIFLENKNDKEIYDNDDVNIPGLNDNLGSFKVKLYTNEQIEDI
jgi:hypothetical protein